MRRTWIGNVDTRWRAHQEWQSVLNRTAYQSKLSQGKFLEIGVGGRQN